jgi:accessory gene regulator B
MVDKICNYLTEKIRAKMPETTDEKAEIINYGLQLIIGEIPKMALSIVIAFLVGSVKLVAITLLVLIPYRGFTGGFHLKTHIGCFICTTIMYTLPSIIAKVLPICGEYKIICLCVMLSFGIVMINKYAPADTVNLPILTKKERKFKKNFSYIVLVISLVASSIIQDNVISSVIIYTLLIQTIFITNFAYKLSKCEYGYRNMIGEN